MPFEVFSFSVACRKLFTKLDLLRILATLELVRKERGSQMARIANYEIDSKLEKFESFVNYNNTIVGTRWGSRYTVVHWNTVILDYDVDKREIDTIALGYISQTTSTLLGRVIRALPQEVVEDLLKQIPHRSAQRRILSMARMLRR